MSKVARVVVLLPLGFGDYNIAPQVELGSFLLLFRFIFAAGKPPLLLLPAPVFFTV